SIISAHTIKAGGIAEAVSKMCWGNMIGMQFTANIDKTELFAYNPGSMVLEIEAGTDLSKLFTKTNYTVLGKTIAEPVIRIGSTELQLSRLQETWEAPLEKVFPTTPELSANVPEHTPYTNRNTHRPTAKIAVPRVLITVFPGTNCEYDTARAFEKAGAEVDTFTVKNLTPADVDNSVKEMAAKIKQTQIIMIPGGFSAGDEPDGSGKFIAAFFRNPHIKDVVNELVGKRDGLMLGICNGFQALIKLGLVPFGEIRDMDERSPNLTFNTIGRHISHAAYTKVCSVKSPWLSYLNPGDIHAVAVSHGEGRFVAPQEIIDTMYSNGQVATQYVDSDGKLTTSSNLNGSFSAIEGITSPDGRILGKMGHSERIGNFVARNWCELFQIIICLQISKIFVNFRFFAL
ncbi:MAG: phosphoribosylformylglycinamidine synthase subunit PurQ, partial [Fibrobacter sp.]|nr:phosphoribosylformylglycinamidine synthase subunit PurQ [Fibrobacter sp.]